MKVLRRLLMRLWRGPDQRARQSGERCETCHWCDIIGDDPDDEPNGYCIEPGNAAENSPYAGSFVGTQSWCRFWKLSEHPPSPDARLTDSEKGKAIGSATHSSSSSTSPIPQEPT